MRTQVILTVISICLLLCATLIFVYSTYAQAEDHVKATARAWKERGLGRTKATVKAPSSECYGFYSMTVQVKGKRAKSQSASFSWMLDESLSLDGIPADSNYAGAYVSDYNSDSPHNRDVDSETDRQSDPN